MEEAWRCAYASVTGSSHERTGTPCQDAGLCRVVRSPGGAPILLAVASDGAGSAARSADGARLAVDLFMEDFAWPLERGESIRQINRGFVTSWIERLRMAIMERAAVDGLACRDFACTVLGAIVGTDRAAFFQIGDGAIVISHAADPDDYGWVFWPQHGEFANQTNFVTQDDAAKALEFETFQGRVDQVALFTDGIERLVLDMTERTAHAPFFKTLFAWLARAGTPREERPSSALMTYLGSKPVTDRTDDDKTLILATRRPMPRASETNDAAADQAEAL